MQGNQLKDISSLAALNRLGHLEASNNEIADLRPLQNLKNMTGVLLSRNLVEDISPLASLDSSSLQGLDLSDNRIARLSGSFSDWSSGTQINLNNNPLLCGEIEAARSNAQITLTFDTSCSASEDIDGDGVPDNTDAFPDDPAASVDTDSDGKPDDWNDGKSAADSSSDPILVIDEDDDNDGVA